MAVTARSFAKIIFSGEHSILYGQPALGMSVDRFVEVSLIEQKGTKGLVFDLPDLNLVKSFSHDQLEELLSKNILPHPSDLAPYAFIKLITKFRPSIFSGITIRIISNIPIGCGLGSSAAVIVSLIHAFNYFFKLNIKLENYWQIGKEIEHIQHGRSSGFDIYLAIYGKRARFVAGEISTQYFQSLPMYYINTGKSKSTTGDCVKLVEKYFQNSSLADLFGEVTNKLDTALRQRDLTTIKESIRTNHRLLVDIGVVPKKVQDFIYAIERSGGAAKICGAGAVAGENAGIIMINTENDITDLLLCYGYKQLIMNFNNNGVEIV